MKRSTVAEMPHTIGTGGMLLCPLISRWTVVARLRSSLKRLVPLRIPLWASSSTMYSVRSSASIVIWIVSHSVHVRVSLRVT